MIISKRHCDVCAMEYTPEIISWMVLNVPNAPEDVVAEYDICSWPCLEKWVNETEPDDAGLDLGPEHDIARAHGGDDAQAKLDKAMAEMAIEPPMSLAQALASGKLEFDRGPQ